MTRLAGCQNLTPATSGEAMYAFTEYMINTIGWTLTAESDGSGASITTGVAGAGGYGNTSAYREIEDPAGRRRFSFQRGTEQNWRFKCIEKDGSSGSTATQVPGGTPELVFSGGGTDASPTYQEVFEAYGTRFHAVADTAPIAGTDVYPFWFGHHLIGNTFVHHAVIVDGLLAGTYHPSDESPMVIYSRNSALWPGPGPRIDTSVIGGTTTLTSSIANSGFLGCFLGSALTPTTLTIAGWGSNVSGGYTAHAGTGGIGSWPYGAGEEGGIGVQCGRTSNNSAPTGFKGVTATWKWSFGNSIATMGSISLTTADAYVAFGPRGGGGTGFPFLLPWVQNLAPIL